MPDFSDKHRHAKGVLNRASQLLEDLELGRGDADDLQGRIQSNCTELERALRELTDIVEDERSGRRSVMMQKLRALNEEHEDVKMGLQKYLTGAAKRRRAARERQALFAGVDPPDPSSYEGVDALKQEADHIDHAASSVDSLIEESRAVLDALHSQSRTFQNTRQRLTSLIESSALSRSILQSISRTERTDSLIVYAGMVVITFLMVLIWWFR